MTKEQILSKSIIGFETKQDVELTLQFLEGNGIEWHGWGKPTNKKNRWRYFFEGYQKKWGFFLIGEDLTYNLNNLDKFNKLIMSSYIKTIGKYRWVCIDDYFWNHHYWYVKLKEWENWNNFKISNKDVLTESEFNKLINKKDVIKRNE